MVTINWCLTQKNGIELIEPNDNLSQSYFKEAKETLLQIRGTGSKWEVIMAYYACYHALYALLQKAGIKCEIHDCTIEMLPLIKAFTNQDYLFLQNLKRRRIDAQYYLKPERLESPHPVKQFVLRCEEIAQNLDVAAIRGKIHVW
ncbi:hypothetical protein J4210_02250 [Candidatus Woesearchaeota archaeon]|nr:hypothetical protein [Candidatus Woesearchaeota archaeon]